MQLTKMVINLFHLHIQKLLLKPDRLLLQMRSKVSREYRAQIKGQHRGVIDLMSCYKFHVQPKSWIFQQQSARKLKLLTQCCHVSPSHEHCRLILIHPYLSGQNLQLDKSNPQPPVLFPNIIVTDIHVMGHL